MLVNHGHREHDVLWEYSIEKTHRYFDDIIDHELRQRSVWANMIATCIMCFNTTQTKEHANQQRARWKKYISSIDPKEIREKEKEIKNPLKTLAQLVPIFMPQPEEKESDDT